MNVEHLKMKKKLMNYSLKQYPFLSVANSILKNSRNKAIDFLRSASRLISAIICNATVGNLFEYCGCKISISLKTSMIKKKHLECLRQSAISDNKLCEKIQIYLGLVATACDTFGKPAKEIFFTLLNMMLLLSKMGY